jgi:hypothetical protein
MRELVEQHDRAEAAVLARVERGRSPGTHEDSSTVHCRSRSPGTAE